MKNKTKFLLPKMTPGTVHAQMNRCGRQSCKCSRGDLHGPYYYYFIRVDRKLHKRYLRSHEVLELQMACLARQEEEKARRAEAAEFWRSLRKIRDDIRRCRHIYQKPYNE